MSYLLGIDNGGTVAKAAVFDLEGNELAVATRKVEAATPQPGWTELDMDLLWSATAEAVREAIGRAQIDPNDIACAACCGYGNGLFLLDDAGRPVRRAVYSADARARSYIDRWTADGVARAVRPKTMQSVWPGQPNALLAWLRDHEPEALRRAKSLLMCKDYIRFRLTGEVAMEQTDMSATSLINVAECRHDPSVLEAFGIAEMQRLLPPLVRCDTICGRVTDDAARLTGLAPGTPVAGGLFDIDACGLASGLVDDGQLSIVVGTWGNNQYISTRPVASDIFMTSCYALPDHYLMLEGSPTSGNNLEWFVTEFFQAERQQAQQAGTSVFDLCNRLVQETRPEDSGLVFLPFLYGSNVSPDAKGCFLGLDGWQRRGHVLRAIYEGVVFSHQWHIERLRKFRGPFERICLTGGAARSDAWMQIFADVLRAPVEIPAGTELGALGSAICAAVAAGLYPSFQAACRQMVRIARTYEPCAARAELYAAKSARYAAALRALEPVWAELAWKRG
jgi:L-xylulokinase